MAKHKKKRRGGAKQRQKFAAAAKVCWKEIASGDHKKADRPAKVFGKCMRREM